MTGRDSSCSAFQCNKRMLVVFYLIWHLPSQEVPNVDKLTRPSKTHLVYKLPAFFNNSISVVLQCYALWCEKPFLVLWKNLASSVQCISVVMILFTLIFAGAKITLHYCQVCIIVKWRYNHVHMHSIHHLRLCVRVRHVLIVFPHPLTQPTSRFHLISSNCSWIP